MWTFLALTSLVILGGFLSYYGDLQGRRWGKKRVSLFGLRPKHTAILITSITGSVISLLSVLTVLIVFPPIRDVILSGERAIRENRRLLSESEEQKRFSDAQIKDQRMAAAIIQAKLDRSQSELLRISQEKDHAETELAQKQTELTLLTRKNVDVQKQNGKISDDNRRLTRIRQNLNHENGVLTLRNQQTEQLNQKAEQINYGISRQNVAMTRENLSLERQKKELEANNSALREKNDRLVSNNVELEKKNGVLSGSNLTLLAQNSATLQQSEERKRTLETEIRSLQARIIVINRQMQDLQSGAESAFRLAGSLRSQKVTSRSGDILARRTLDAHSRPEVVERELTALLEDASAMALLRGGSRGLNGRAVVTVGANQTLLTGSQSDRERAVTAALAKQLIASNTPILLTATAVANSVAGEQLVVELDGIPVRALYQKGEVIAKTTLDGGRSVEQVVDDVVRFLQREVRETALEAGTQPQLNAATGAREVGSLTPAELVSLTDRIRRIKGKVQLTALASSNLTTADPLRISFRVERAKAD